MKKVQSKRWKIIKIEIFRPLTISVPGFFKNCNNFKTY